MRPDLTSILSLLDEKTEEVDEKRNETKSGGSQMDGVPLIFAWLIFFWQKMTAYKDRTSSHMMATLYASASIQTG